LVSRRLAAVVVDDHGFVSNPDRAPVAGDQAVGAAPWFQRAFTAFVFSQDAVPVRGVQARLPEVRDVAFLGGVPGPGLDLGSDADP
jgi:hypothetical protein